MCCRNVVESKGVSQSRFLPANKDRVRSSWELRHLTCYRIDRIGPELRACRECLAQQRLCFLDRDRFCDQWKSSRTGRCLIPSDDLFYCESLVRQFLSEEIIKHHFLKRRPGSSLCRGAFRDSLPGHGCLFLENVFPGERIGSCSSRRTLSAPLPRHLFMFIIGPPDGCRDGLLRG